MIARRHRARSRRSAALFITVGTLAGVSVALLAFGMVVGAIPPLVAVLASAALAAWLYAIARMIELAQQPTIPTSLDCRDGRHLACTTCSCPCHTKDA